MPQSCHWTVACYINIVTCNTALQMATAWNEISHSEKSRILQAYTAANKVTYTLISCDVSSEVGQRICPAVPPPLAKLHQSVTSETF